MGATTLIAKVIANWDNRENTNNYQYHKPHHLIVFEGDTKESPNRAKINYGTDPLANQYRLAMAQAIQRERTYVFTLETGETEGHPWRAIREVRDPAGTLLGVSDPPENAPPAAPPAAAPVPPATVPLPAAVPPPAAPKAPAVPPAAVPPPVPGPAKNGNGAAKTTEVRSMLTERTPEFWAQKDELKEQRMTRGEAFKCAVSLANMQSDQFVQLTPEGELILQKDRLQAFIKDVCDMYTTMLRSMNDQDLVDRYMVLLNVCEEAADVGLLMQQAKDRLPAELYAGLRDVATKVQQEIKAGRKPAPELGRY